VNQENATRFEPNNQIFAAALEGTHLLAFELGCDFARVVRPGQPSVRDLNPIEDATDHAGLEPRADRLDLWQLGHAASVATRLWG
jgi:hypothetical protein